MRDRLTSRDWLFIAACVVLAIAALFVIDFYSEAAFPEASIDFKYDRADSRRVAEGVLRAQHIRTDGMKHAAVFDSDSRARIFLERSLGLQAANRLLRHDVHLWTWHHRWFVPLQEEEYSVDVAPDGAIVAFTHRIAEDRAIATPAIAEARRIAETFLARNGVKLADLQLVAQSERKLPKRTQRIFTWDSRSVRPAGAPYRTTVTIDGNVVSSYAQRIDVPDAWLRSYSELRSKNIAAGQVDSLLMIATMLAALVVFIIRLRRGDLHLRFVLFIGGVAVVLVAAVTLNSWPTMLAGYDTRDSFASFLGQITLQVVTQSLGTAMMLIVVCGAGEVLYRERLPRQLAIPRLWSGHALRSKRVFRSLILGYALVPLFIAYQAIFYVVAEKFGAWSPAQVPYDEMLNSALPWAAVLFAGFFPAFSEEFLSRAFSIPFFQRFFRSRIFAIVLAGFIWGFGHATYPNQPFYIRGLEVGIAGVILGFLMDRYGLLSLLVWHYTVDAIYTALLLFRSGNAYYVSSAALASLIFAVPLFVSIALYIRNKGFLPDDELTNASLPIEPQPEPIRPSAEPVTFPPAIRVTRMRVLVCIALVAIAAIAIVMQPPSVDDSVDYRIGADEAKAAAAAHLRALGQPLPTNVAAIPRSGFRGWDGESSVEEGGSPTSFDDVAATHLVRKGMSIAALNDVFRDQLEASLWSVRFYTPLQKREYFVDIDPRNGRVIGYHKYQEQKEPGPRLEQAAAVDVARRALPRYGLDPAAFDLQEALNFQQPNRRDWLLHFQERRPLAGDAYRRVTVRVQGSEVTQVAKNIKVPDSVHRDAETRTFLSIVFVTAKIVGIVMLMALTVTGLVVALLRAARGGGVPWRRVLKWTLVLTILPILAAFARWPWSLFNYSTTIAWSTFQVNLATGLVVSFAGQLGAIFLALAGLAAIHAYVFELPRREGRARFGRDAAIAAITAIAAIVILQVVLSFVATVFPAVASIDAPNIPSDLVVAWPAPFVLARAISSAIVFAGAAALYAWSLRTNKHGWIAPAVTITGIFGALFNAGATPAEAPFAIAYALAAAIVLWLLARYVLRDNPLAWPLAAFLFTILYDAAPLLHNHLATLQANAIALIVIAAATVAWLALPSPDRE